MKIHTNNPEEVKQLLAELNLSYKIMSKKFNKHEGVNWIGLPSFIWDTNLSKIICFNVPLKEDERTIFFAKFGVKNTKLQYIHYKKEPLKYRNYKYKFTHIVNPQYPIYVLSKGRWNKRLTIDALEKMKCPYKLVIEPTEFDKYNKYVDKENILVIPEKYLNKDQGGIPARNFIWQNAIDRGFTKHWILDDNIKCFLRWNYNTQKRIDSGVIFRVIEQYARRYTNIGLCGMSYFFSVPAIQVQRKIITNNSRCYSCILINHKLLDTKLKERWRGKYNEDTDLSIRVLRANLSTFLFNNFICDKITSGTMKGGNTDDLYKGGTHEGYMDKFKALKAQHPEFVKLTYNKHRDKRPHHHINYKKVAISQPILKKRYQNYKDMEMGIWNSNEYNMIFYNPDEVDEIEEITELLEVIEI